MLLITVVSPVLGANCYVVAVDGSRECLIIDPGIRLDRDIDAVMAKHSLRPIAALITHGHVDHTFGLTGLCQRYDMPVYLHEADAYRLDDPIGTLGLNLASLFAELGNDWAVPSDVRTFSHHDPLELAGIRIHPMHAPGHTEGSTLYYCPASSNDQPGLCFTGDVLFAGTIGRTDLPGGNSDVMRRTLERLAQPESAGGLPEQTIVLPGHGDSSTLKRERDTNPHLRRLQPSH